MEKQLPNKRMLSTAKAFLLVVALSLAHVATYGQGRTITGVVSDQLTNETLPGASVIVKGSTKGSSTDINGKYSLSVGPQDKVLEVSFIGYITKEIAIGTENVVNVQLSQKLTTLDEVVVVGYGTSKVKDLTSSITTIKSDDLLKTPSSQPMQALQGKVAGMQVVSSGKPGAGASVRIRGIGSFPTSSNEAPLYVVDGMFYDNIDFLSATDIESISVLKDASALAIYGVRAANGVVLVETKSGKHNQKVNITYDGYIGTQVAQNVVKMANAEQFTSMALESGSETDASYILNAMQRYGRSRVNPNVPDVNTDWYSEILQPAKITNHSLSFDGGTEKAKYAIGGSYFFQEGLMKTKNQYERVNLRTKVEVKAQDWLTIGGNFIFSNSVNYIAPNNAWNLAYFAVPIIPVYDELNTEAWPENYSNAKFLGYRSSQNPLVTIDLDKERQKIRKLISNIFLDFSLIPSKLTFKTTFNTGFANIEQRNVYLPYNLGQNVVNLNAKLSKSSKNEGNLYWDNILTYTEKFGNHNLTVMAGSSYKNEFMQELRSAGISFNPNIEQSWYLAQSIVSADETSDNGKNENSLSYFGRVSYNYADRYLLYGTFRADGTQKYQEKWGYFPTIGIGWIASEEKFLKNNDIIDFLKIRASWGQLGNDKIGASTGTNTKNSLNTTMGGVLQSGTIAINTFSYLKWEVVEETNIGLTTKVLKNRLSFDFDYFTRDTKNAVIPVAIPVIGGTINSNVGTIRNKGIEFDLTWNDQIGSKLNYSVGANVSTLKNEVIDLYGQPYVDGGSAEFRQRSIVGQPILAFYGREIEGVYQTTEECETDPVAVENGLVPGDFKYKDQNRDGVIDEDDRVVLGSYFPSLTYGFNLAVYYLNFDLSANFYGQSGNKILNRKRGELIWTADGNLDADLAINRWHGEGTSDKYPSSAGLRKGWNQKMSDYFVEDGSFFRIQNIQLGYTLKKSNWLGGSFPETRIQLTADRPLTVFNYNGFTPEISDGIDTQTYPLPSVYTIGLNVKF